MVKTPIVIWVEAEQKNQVEQAAKAKGLSMSAWGRYQILTAISELDKLNAVQVVAT